MEALPPLTVTEAELRADLSRIVNHLAGEIGERNAARRWQLADAIDYVALELEGLGLRVDRQGYDADAEVVAQNLVVELRGTLAAEEIVVVAAHLDSPPGSPGASAATGVAALLVLGRRLRDEQPTRTLRLVVASLCEGSSAETETAGSRVYSRRARERDEQLVAAIALDSLGYYAPRSPQRRSPAITAPWPTHGDFLALLAEERDRELLQRAQARLTAATSLPIAAGILSGPAPEFGASDAWGFAAEAIPTLRLTDTARLRNPDHGTPGDRPEQLDLDRLARAVASLEALILDLAGRGLPGPALSTDPGSGLVRPQFE